MCFGLNKLGFYLLSFITYLLSSSILINFRQKRFFNSVFLFVYLQSFFFFFFFFLVFNMYYTFHLNVIFFIFTYNMLNYF